MARKPDFPLWQRAASLAAKAHQHQKRKDGETPYFAHPVRVCLTLRTVFGCEDEAALAAALLHDTIEDTTTDFDEIEEEFGEEVASLVASVTKNMILREDEREKEYDARLARADWRARLIKCADVYDNLCDCVQSGRPTGSAADKARRAIALSQTDSARHPETARAIGCLRALLSSTGGSQRARKATAARRG